MRYLKITLLLGALACIVALALHGSGSFFQADRALGELLGGVATLARLPEWIHYVVVLGCGFGIAWSTIDIYRLSLKIVVAAGALLNVITATWVLSRFEYFFSPFPAAVAIVLGFALGMFYARSEGGARKQRLRLLFGERLSRRGFYALLNAPSPPKFEGELREASVMVCEVFNHDELMDALETSEYVTLMNLFLQNASEFLVEKGACLDECDGECLRVIFGSPVPDDGHARTACETALDLALRLENLNRECEVRWHRRVDWRIGINSGEMVSAAFGSGRLASFSVAGEAVELARRLCAANLRYGSKILIGPHTLTGAGEMIEVRPMEILGLRDQRSQVEIYELLARKDALNPEELERREAFWKGIIYFREHRWEEALDHFQAALPPGGGDPPVQVYLERIQRIRTGGEIPAEWDAASAQ